MDPTQPLNPNEKTLRDLLQEFKTDMSIRELMHHLFEKGLPRMCRWRTVGQTWNYHLVQMDLSRLVGRGLVEMIPAGKHNWHYRLKPAERQPVDAASTVSAVEAPVSSIQPTYPAHGLPSNRTPKDLGEFA